MSKVIVNLFDQDGNHLMEHKWSTQDIDSINNLSLKQTARIVWSERKPREYTDNNGVTYKFEYHA